MKFIKLRSEKRKEIVWHIFIGVSSLLFSILFQIKLNQYADEFWQFYSALADCALVLVFLIGYIIRRCTFQRVEALLDVQNKIIIYNDRRIKYANAYYMQSVSDRIFGLYRLEIVYYKKSRKKVRVRKIKLKKITEETMEEIGHSFMSEKR